MRVVGTGFHQPLPGLRQLDVTDAEALWSFVKTTRPATIFLPAANPNVDLCETDPASTRIINVESVGRVAELAAELNARVVFYSSDYVFDGKSGPYAETDLPNPICEYGRQKLEAEELLRSILPENHLILRVTVVYGWEQNGKNFLARMVRTLREGRTMRVPNDQIGTPTLVDDIADASWTLAGLGANGTMHLAGPDLVDRFSFARQAAQVFGLDPELLRPVTTPELKQIAPRPLRAGMVSRQAEILLGRGLIGIADGLAQLKAQI